MDLKTRYFSLLCAMFILTITYVVISKRKKEIEASFRRTYYRRNVNGINEQDSVTEEGSILDSNISNTTKSVNNPFVCYQNLDNIPTIQDILEVNVTKGRNIVFLETSCRSREEGRLTLNARQACAIESAARSNPNMEVYLLITAPALMQDVNGITNKFLDSILKLKNVRIYHANIYKYFVQTPVENLFNSGKLTTSTWPLIHLSDVMRFVTMWRYGAIYMDLDVVILKSFEDLEPNFTGLEDGKSVASGIMQFDHLGNGHDWLEAILKDINDNFKPDIWGYNANGALERFLNEICNTKDVNQMHRENCQGFEVFSSPVLYPIPYYNWMDYFDVNYLQSTMELVDQAMAVHMWNKLSANEVVYVGTNTSAYELIARQYCPTVYSLLDDTF